jgi:hypothetical protein
VAQPLDGRADHVVQVLGFLPKLRVLDAAGERLCTDVGGAHHLDRVVVDVGRDPPPLLLLRVLEPQEQLPAVLHRPPQDVEAPPEAVLDALGPGDVGHDAAPEQRVLVRAADQHGLVVDPDLAPVGGEQPILRAERVAGRERPAMLSQHPFAIVLVHPIDPQLRIVTPLLDGEAEERFDLRARVDVRGVVVVGVDVQDRWDPLHQVPVGLVRLPELVGELRRQGDLAHSLYPKRRSSSLRSASS